MDYYICGCGAKVYCSGGGVMLCPACGVEREQEEGGLRRVVWYSSSGKGYEEEVGVGVDLDALVGEYIKVGNVRIRVKSYEVL